MKSKYKQARKMKSKKNFTNLNQKGTKKSLENVNKNIKIFCKKQKKKKVSQ